MVQCSFQMESQPINNNKQQTNKNGNNKSDFIPFLPLCFPVKFLTGIKSEDSRLCTLHGSKPTFPRTLDRKLQSNPDFVMNISLWHMCVQTCIWSGVVQFYQGHMVVDLMSHCHRHHCGRAEAIHHTIWAPCT